MKNENEERENGKRRQAVVHPYSGEPRTLFSVVPQKRQGSGWIKAEISPSFGGVVIFLGSKN